MPSPFGRLTPRERELLFKLVAIPVLALILFYAEVWTEHASAIMIYGRF